MTIPLRAFNPALRDDEQAPLTLHPAGPAGNPVIAMLLNAHSMDLLGGPHALIDDQGRMRQVRYTPGTPDRALVTTPAGEAVAYAFCSGEAPFVVTEVGGVVHPAYRRRGIGTALLRWAERQARAILAAAPADAHLVLNAHCYDVDQGARALLGQEGYHRAREWIHLTVILDEPPPAPVFPPGITVRELDQRSDWPQVGPALDEAFMDHWGQIGMAADPAPSPDPPADGQPSTATAIEDDPYFNSAGLCFVALHGDEVVGSCLCNARTIEWPDVGRVGSLSIRRPYRRQGIARALLHHAFGAFYQRGVRRIVTDTDGASFTGANHLYAQVGMSIYRRELTFERTLRPGREWRALHAVA